MNCDECQDLISLFLDNELDEGSSAAVEAHLSLCSDCEKLFDDFSLIIGSCSDVPLDETVPPNSDAMWCRINNILESEVAPQQPSQEPKKGWISRGWSFTFSQVGAAIVGIAVISSLLTVVGLRNYFEPSGDDTVSRSEASQTTFEKLLSKVGLAETPQQARERRIREQQAAIDYWTRRVTARRAQWDAKMRDAFDRNLYTIDESVTEYNQILQQNPDDELSGEMLNAVLDEKMNLLRAFSDL
jgi:Putative zinc-finger